MNKRILKKLAQAGHFKKANGALYAAAKRALRKPLYQDYLQMSDEPGQESLTAFGVSSIAVSTSPKTTLPNARKKQQKQFR
ncbi:MAG: hypothetical protein ALAOOOJD_02221 [bacterium]|nr:hypothetical protein [bacterium]